MTRKSLVSSFRYSAAIVALAMSVLVAGWKSNGEETPKTPDPAPAAGDADEKTFQEVVQPLLKKYCFRCHNSEKMKSGVRVDQLTGTIEDRHLAHWKNILK